MKKSIKILILVLAIVSFNKTYAKTITGITNDKNIKVKTANKTYKIGEGIELKITGQEGNNYIVKGDNKLTGKVAKSDVTITYILVDISDQKLYTYSNGSKKMTASVVTGTKGVSDTPTGHYKLKRSNFKRNTYLMNNSYVEYWMPFITSRGIGFHDASWRKSSNFNKKTYLKNGSHGCVNMKKNDAKKLYNSAPSVVDVFVRN